MAKPYEREPNGLRLAFHGINIVRPPDAMPIGKVPLRAERPSLPARSNHRPRHSRFLRRDLTLHSSLNPPTE